MRRPASSSSSASHTSPMPPTAMSLIRLYLPKRWGGTGPGGAHGKVGSPALPSVGACVSGSLAVREGSSVGGEGSFPELMACGIPGCTLPPPFQCKDKEAPLQGGKRDPAG